MVPVGSSSDGESTGVVGVVGLDGVPVARGVGTTVTTGVAGSSDGYSSSGVVEVGRGAAAVVLDLQADLVDDGIVPLVCGGLMTVGAAVTVGYSSDGEVAIGATVAEAEATGAASEVGAGAGAASPPEKTAGPGMT